MIETQDSNIGQCFVHSLQFSEPSDNIISSPLDFIDKNIHTVLHKWLFNSLSQDEFFHMSPNLVDPALQISKLIGDLFDDNSGEGLSHHQTASLIFKELNGSIQTLITATVENLLFEDELCNGFVIAFPNPTIPFLDFGSIQHSNTPLILSGWPLDKMNMGVLILDTFKEDGRRICLKNTSKRDHIFETVKSRLLSLSPVANPFHYTNNYLKICNKFIKEQLPEEVSITRTEQADILNKSMSYFKSADSFSEPEFLDSIFPNEELSESFKQYKKSYVAEHELKMPNDFDISDAAVKKQQRVFKSVLKLDKNFHIYIHGDKELIHKGADPDGRKYYKIYFQEEH